MRAVCEECGCDVVPPEFWEGDYALWCGACEGVIDAEMMADGIDQYGSTKPTQEEAERATAHRHGVEYTADRQPSSEPRP